MNPEDYPVEEVLLYWDVPVLMICGKYLVLAGENEYYYAEITPEEKEALKEDWLENFVNIYERPVYVVSDKGAIIREQLGIERSFECL